MPIANVKMAKVHFSDTFGNVYSYDGSTLTAMSGTPFTPNNYVSSIEEYNGSIYFGTSISSIYRYDGYTYEQVYVYGVSNPQAIVDMAAWQKDGYLYVSVGPRGICCPPTGYTIRSSSGNTGSWEIVFQDVWHTTILMPTPDYLYTAVLDSAYCHCSTVRKSSEGTTFPVIYPSDGQYKVMWGSMYYDGIAYFFADDQMYGFGEIIIDDNGSVSRITNQNWMLTQAVELNGEIYALAGTHRYIPGGVYLITTGGSEQVAPVADAGEDQTVYADADFTGEVTLDGSGSNDPDGDELSYLWTWTIGGETHQTTGVNPQIELPVGEYTVELIVNDGQEDSEPDQVVIVVIAPMQASLWVVPRVINRYSSMPQIMAMVRLAGISKEQVDGETPLMLYPGGIAAVSQRASECGRGGMHSTMIFASFDKSDLMDAAPDNGSVGLTAVGRLKSGQYFCGADTIRIIAPGLPR